MCDTLFWETKIDHINSIQHKDRQVDDQEKDGRDSVGQRILQPFAGNRKEKKQDAIQKKQGGNVKPDTDKERGQNPWKGSFAASWKIINEENNPEDSVHPQQHDEDQQRIDQMGKYLFSQKRIQ